MTKHSPYTLQEVKETRTARLFSEIYKSDQKYTLFIGLKVENVENLAVDGGESLDDLHITLAYGYFTPRSDEEDATCRIQSAIAAVQESIPDKIHFDAIDRFTATGSSDGKDVIYARVAAGQLEEVNKNLLAALEKESIKLETTFPEYKPHMTLAYIDPSKAYKLSKINATGDVTKILIGHGKNTEESRNNTFSIQKTDDDKHLVFGWANIAIRANGEQIEDLQGDIMDPDDLEEGAYKYVLNFRDAGEEHHPGFRKKARMVESVVFTKEKMAAMGIPEGIVPEGWWIGFYVDDKDTWEKIKNGTYSMFSIEGKGTRIPVRKSNRDTVAKSFSELMKFNPYHGKDGRFTTSNGYASFSANPNTKAGMAAIKREQKNNPLVGAAFGTKRSVGQIEQDKRDKQSKRKAKEILNNYEVTENQKAIITNIQDFYRNADTTNNIRLRADGTIGIKRSAHEGAMKIARNAADNIRITDNSTKAEYDEIRSYVKRTPVKISAQDKSNIVDYDAYRRSAFGNLTISNNGISIDSFYQQLSESYPHLFNSQKVTNPGDQLMNVNNVLNNLRPRQKQLSGELKEQAVSSIYEDIIHGYFGKDLPMAKSFSEIAKFNPYHDKLGRFATRGGYVSFSPGSGAQGARSIARENKRRQEEGDEPNVVGAHANIGRMTFAEARAKLRAGGVTDKPQAEKPKEPEKPKTRKGLESGLGKEHAEKIENIVQKSPENIQKVWDKYGDGINVLSANHKGTASCDAAGNIKVNVERHTIDTKLNNAYEVIMHESGHAIDQVISHSKFGKRFSVEYKDGLFEKTIKSEVDGHIKRKQKELQNDEQWKSENSYAVGKNGKVRIDAARNAMSKELRQGTFKTTGDVSDIFEGATEGRVTGTAGHGTSYWVSRIYGSTIRRSVAVEAFAEMFSATTTNPESLANIQKYFPESYGVFNEMLTYAATL